MAHPTQAVFNEILTARWRAYTAATPVGPLLDYARPLEGQLLRPGVAWFSAQAAGLAPADVADAALAVQCIHTASVLHDDVIDEAATRRGRATLTPKKGVLAGDLLITAAYDLAARLGEATPAFARAVQRMAFGEARQNSQLEPDWATYIEMLADKSGALFGWSMAAPWFIAGNAGMAARAQSLGDRIGVIYQLLDDYLDWCPYTDTGKPPLQDARQGKRTLPVFEFHGHLASEVAARVVDVYAGGAMRRALGRIEREAAAWSAEATLLLGAHAAPFNELIESFVRRARDAYAQNRTTILFEEKQYA